MRRRASLPVVAVTGSVGKTTTKDMTATLLATRGPVLKTEGNLNNQYGLPLTLLRLRSEHSAAVLELGMSAAGEIRALAALARPDVAVITRIAPVHLEFFASLDAIAEAKAEILDGLGSRGTAVLNGDDPRVARIGERFSGRVLWFGRGRGLRRHGHGRAAERLGHRASTLRVAGRGRPRARCRSPGPHFVENFLAAAAAAHVLGVPAAAIAEAARSPRGRRATAARCCASGEGVVLLDDCYNSSPAALEAAVVTLGLLGGPRRVAVLGDMLELGPSAGLRCTASAAAALRRPRRRRDRRGLAREGDRDRARARPASRARRSTTSRTRPRPRRPRRSSSRAGDAVLVKASRGVRLETVVDALRRALRESGGLSPCSTTSSTRCAASSRP